MFDSNVLDLADKICLDCTALASSVHYLHNYGAKLSEAELASQKKHLVVAIKQHIDRANELMVRVPCD